MCCVCVLLLQNGRLCDYVYVTLFYLLLCMCYLVSISLKIDGGMLNVKHAHQLVAVGGARAAVHDEVLFASDCELCK